MTAKDFRSFIRTAAECRIVVSLVTGSDTVEVKCTKTALRSAIKGVPSGATVNATFREDDGTLLMDSTTPDVPESDNDLELPEVVEG